MKKFKEFLKEQPTNWTRSTVAIAGFSADAESPVAGVDLKLFPASMDVLSQDFQTPEELNKPIYSDWGGVYPVIKLSLDSDKGDGPSIDSMVKASQEYTDFLARHTQQVVKKNLGNFLNKK